MDKQEENKRRMINIAQLCICRHQCDGDDDYIRQAIAYLTVALKIVPQKE